MSKRHMVYKLTKFLNVYDIRSKIALVVIFSHCNGATVWYVEHDFVARELRGKIMKPSFLSRELHGENLLKRGRSINHSG